MYEWFLEWGVERNRDGHKERWGETCNPLHTQTERDRQSARSHREREEGGEGGKKGGEGRRERWRWGRAVRQTATALPGT